MAKKARSRAKEATKYSDVSITVLSFSFGVSIIVGVVLICGGGLSGTSDILRYFGFTFAIASILFASFQFRQNTAWKMKEAALINCRRIQSEGQPHLALLHKAFDYNMLTCYTEIPLEDIHKRICKTDKRGKLIKDSNGRAKVTDMKLRLAISYLLNSFEYIAAGVNRGVFDEETVKSLYHRLFIKCRKNFNAYIKHARNDMYPDRSATTWRNFTDFADELIANQEKQDATDN